MADTDYTIGFQKGRSYEQDRIIKQFLMDKKQATKCECENCQSWKNAFDWLATEIRNASENR